MWLICAMGSAVFAGITSILAKCGIRQTDSTIATAIRTIVVLVFAWIMVFAAGAPTAPFLTFLSCRLSLAELRRTTGCLEAVLKFSNRHFS